MSAPSLLSVFLVMVGLCQLQAQSDTSQLWEPIVFRENVVLSGFRVVHTVRLAEDVMLCVARPTEFDAEDEGLRAILLATDSTGRFSSIYRTAAQGEAYVYEPSFQRFDDGEVMIFLQGGFEYMTGADVFRLSGHDIEFLGHANFSNQFDDWASFAQRLYVTRETEHYTLHVYGPLIYAPGQAAERTVNERKHVIPLADAELFIQSR